MNKKFDVNTKYLSRHSFKNFDLFFRVDDLTLSFDISDWIDFGSFRVKYSFKKRYIIQLY